MDNRFIVAPTDTYGMPGSAKQHLGGAPGLREDTSGVTAPISVILAIGTVVTLAVVMLFLSGHIPRPGHLPIASGGRASFGDDGYWLSPTGPDSVPVTNSRLQITIDGTSHWVPLSNFSALAGATQWSPGTRLCIIGDAASCYTASGRTVVATLYNGNDFVFTVDTLRQSGIPFSIVPGTGIVLKGSHQVVTAALGSQYSCGSTMPVYMRMTINGGATWTSPFGSSPVSPSGSGQSFDAGLVPAGSIVGVEGTGDGAPCGLPDYTVNSIGTDARAVMLRAGDPAPAYAPFSGQAPLASFLVPYVNTQTQTMVLDPNQVIIFIDLCCYPGYAVDYQDLVVLFTFDPS